MHRDLDREDIADLRTEVCIIGAGVAGISAARRLLKKGHKVVLLESGGTDYEAATSDLNRGENIGEPYYRLDHARLRFFGGTAAIWGGRVAELDPIDLERRPWVPHSGWPLSWSELRPYYDEAWAELGLERPQGEAPFNGKLELPPFDQARVAPRYWAFDDRSDRFSFAACDDLRRHPECLVLTHATVTEIVTDPSGTDVDHLVVANSSGRECRVHPRATILAAGGIENARLLLASTRHDPKGVGNRNDLVGRFFMEHPHARGGRVVSSHSWDLLKAFGRSHRIGNRRIAALLTPSPAEQEQRGLLNTSLTIAPRKPGTAKPFMAMRLYNRAKHDLPPTRTSRTLWTRGKKAVTAVQMLSDPLRPWLLHRADVLDMALLVRAEQAPNPDSRVILSDDRDGLGMRRIRLDWRLSDIDKHSVSGLVELLGSELERLGIGRVEPAAWLSEPETNWKTDRLVSSHPIGGYHHMGTTRMAADERNGVADASGRVFGTNNLYIAGSSLFPTSGWANPTLTLMALAIRTSDVLSEQINNPIRLPERRLGVS